MVVSSTSGRRPSEDQVEGPPGDDDVRPSGRGRHGVPRPLCSLFARRRAQVVQVRDPGPEKSQREVLGDLLLLLLLSPRKDFRLYSGGQVVQNAGTRAKVGMSYGGGSGWFFLCVSQWNGREDSMHERCINRQKCDLVEISKTVVNVMHRSLVHVSLFVIGRNQVESRNYHERKNMVENERCDSYYISAL